MSDPIRWRASDGGAPAGVRELLQQAAAPTAMDAATRARHAVAIAKVTAGAAPVAAAGAKMALGAKLLAGIGLAAAVAVGAAPAVRARMARHEPQVAVSPARPTAPTAAAVPPATTATATAEAPVAATQSPLPFATTTTPPVAPTHRASPSRRPPIAGAAQAAPVPSTVAAEPAPGVADVATPGLAPASSAPVAPGAPITAGAAPAGEHEDPLTRESNLIDAANAALARDPHEALAQLARHEREFPRGQHAEDREFIAAQALRDLGRGAEARARAQALIAHFPDSPLRGRAQRLIDALP